MTITIPALSFMVGANEKFFAIIVLQAGHIHRDRRFSFYFLIKPRFEPFPVHPCLMIYKIFFLECDALNLTMTLKQPFIIFTGISLEERHNIEFIEIQVTLN